MLYKAVIAVFLKSILKHTNTLCGQNLDFFAFSLAVNKETTSPARVNKRIKLRNVEELVQCSP
jgi:hypothetical protein